ncbi:MAG: hypothetical protein KDB50_15265 [Mycobacterium sp.]|nr:hypothetical protein [Mycobacterium sp.]
MDSRSTERLAAERWFLAQGLPAVLRRGALLRRVWVRSTPALAGLAVIAANSILIVAISGRHTVDIAGRPDLLESLVLMLVVLVLPAVALVGWLVSRVDSIARRTGISVIAVAVIGSGVVIGGPSTRIGVNLTVFGIAIAAILVLTATGIGAILGWVATVALSNLALTAGMFVRALPVVLLTFLVFFNTHVWLMTSLISRARLWLGIVFLLLVAGSFLVATTIDQIRPLISGSNVPPDAPALSGTPFDSMPDPPHTDRLSLGERLNVVFVVAASQLLHVLTVAMLTGAIFFVLGMILVSPAVLDAWTRGTGRADGEIAGMTLPLPDALIQTTLLLTAITFMYLAAKAVTDGKYRAQFLDPMMDTLKQTLRARARYRASRQRP